MFDLIILAGTVPCLAQTSDSDDRPTIESLLKDGWQVAGYTSAEMAIRPSSFFATPIRSISCNAVRAMT